MHACRHAGAHAPHPYLLWRTPTEDAVMVHVGDVVSNLLEARAVA